MKNKNEKEIERLIIERNKFRAIKDWASADRIYSKLCEQGIVLHDSNKGTTWKR